MKDQRVKVIEVIRWNGIVNHGSLLNHDVYHYFLLTLIFIFFFLGGGGGGTGGWCSRGLIENSCSIATLIY